MAGDNRRVTSLKKYPPGETGRGDCGADPHICMQLGCRNVRLLVDEMTPPFAEAMWADYGTGDSG